LLSKDSRVHWKSNSQSGSSFGNARVHSFTLSYIPGSMRCDSQASLLAYTIVSPCFGREPKVRVTTSYVRFVLMDFWFQFLTSHAIFNHCAYAERMNWVISCKFLSFSIRDITFWGTLPMPWALKFDTCNNYSKINLMKFGFGSGGHCYAIIINLSHER